MKVSSVTVKNWRNLATQTILLDDGLNIMQGSNAQGKTNIVESIYVCCLGKSARTDKDRDLVAWGQGVAHVKTKYTCRYGEGEIAVGVTSTNKKSIAVNSVVIPRIGDLLGYLNCIYFSPNEIKIISQSPNERRKFLDIDLCQMDKVYFDNLSRFNKALAQRNNVLKKTLDAEKIKNEIFVWDGIIAECGAKVIYKRKQFLDNLSPLATACHANITDGGEKLTLQYAPNVSGDDIVSIKHNYANMLSGSIDKDIAMRYTTVGCQRDDIVFNINGRDVRTFGSQGQLRTTALSLKLAELEIFAKMIGEYPILLLDDVLSELDIDRQKALLSWANKAQILLTTATAIDNQLLPKQYSIHMVDNGKAIKA